MEGRQKEILEDFVEHTTKSSTFIEENFKEILNSLFPNEQIYVRNIDFHTAFYIPKSDVVRHEELDFRSKFRDLQDWFPCTFYSIVFMPNMATADTDSYIRSLHCQTRR